MAATYPAPSFARETLVLIPALNEAESLANTLEHWRNAGFSTLRVVDNGSTDSTAEVAHQSGAECVREPRRGYGRACLTGLEDWPEACQWVLFSAADGSDRWSGKMTPPWEEAVASGCQLILGDRVSHPEGRRHLKPSQRMGSLVFEACAWLGWGCRFRDMGSLRLLHRDLYRSLQLQDEAFGWNVEMQIKAVEQGARIREIPVPYYQRLAGESKISGDWMGSVRAARGILGMTWKLFQTRHARRGPLPPTQAEN